MRAFIAMIACAVTAQLIGSTEPTTSRGFSADQTYHFSGIDTVNDFTGNLGLTIPLGPTFRTNGSLTYAFTLHYDSNLWDYTQLSPSDPPSAHVTWANTRFAHSTLETYASMDFNAGLGWRLSASGHPKRYTVIEDAAFVDESGALHKGAHWPAAGRPPIDLSTTFSPDGTYLRYSTDGLTATVEHPDGIRERYLCISECGTGRAWYDLDQRSDPFGDVLYVTRAAEPTGESSIWVWTYHEAVSATPYVDHNAPGSPLTEVRVHTVEYTRDTRMPSHYRITKLKLASAGTGNVAEYDLQYSFPSIARPYSQTSFTTPNAPWGPPPQRMMTVAVLDGVTLPEPGSWGFKYVIDPSQDYGSDLVIRSTNDPSITFLGSHFAGLLSAVTLPTNGVLQYKYAVRRFGKYECNSTPTPSDPSNPQFIHVWDGTGVSERRVIMPDHSTDGDRPWQYFGFMEWPLATGFCPNLPWPREFVSATLDPFGKLDVHYFSIFNAGLNPNGVWDKHEWGMPLSKEETDSAGRFLQSRVFNCVNVKPFVDDPESAVRRLHPRYLNAGESLTCADPNADSNHQFSPVRTSYVQWEHDADFCEVNGCDQTNRRVRATATVFHDDGDTFTENVGDQYDGFGHYRQYRLGGNLFNANFPSGVVGGDERVTFTGYNPGVVFQNGAYTALPDGASRETMPWILTTYDLKKTIQGQNGQAGSANPTVASTLFRFNPATGFLDAQRTLRSSVDCPWNASTAHAACFDSGHLDAADLQTTFTRLQNDTATTIKADFFGGDGAVLSTSDDLTKTPLGSSVYKLHHTYRFGGLESSAYFDCAGFNRLLTIEDNTVDPHTGLILTSIDGSGAATTYAYDNLGRFTAVDPPGADAATTYQYVAASLGQPARVTATADPGLRTTTYEFDGMGRLTLERNQVPGDHGLTTSARILSYRVDGAKVFETTAGPEPGIGFTTTQSFDLFGRPLIVNHPDNASDHRKFSEFKYFGNRSVVETIHGVQLASGLNGTSGCRQSSDCTQTTKLYDRFGNLAKVVEDAGDASAHVGTRYEYDPLDQLTLVDGANGQKRFFQYDMRGFLISSKEPELGGRTIRLLGYDPRGNFGQRLFSGPNEPPTPFDLAYTYDAAERLQTVTQVSTGRMMKRLSYYPPDPDVYPFAAGKLMQRERDNWVPSPDAPSGAPINIPVTEDFTYDKVNGTGRVRTRNTTIGALSFSTGFSYDGLGNVSSLQYPAITTGCLASGCGVPSRTVTFNYQQGRLTEISSIASLTYAPSGAISTIAHSNGAVDKFAADPNSLPRFSSTRTTFPGAATFDTGAYAYDGAGNVAAIGDQTYRYDNVNRLLQASLSNGTQIYSYDAAGNMTNMNGVPLPVDPATNRLNGTQSDGSPAAVYDIGGNLTSWTDPRDHSVLLRDFDPFGLVMHNRGGGQGKIYLYDAADERAAVFDYASSPNAIRETWSVRGLSNEVLRDITRTRAITGATAPTWTWYDYIRRGTTLVAEVRPLSSGGEETLHVHVDHLGSVRRISNAAGTVVDTSDFYPFGQQILDIGGTNRFKFTGHERDGAPTSLSALDYMHARYYSAAIGRFLSVDPALGTPSSPQTWNRYTYSANNPERFVDPKGRQPFQAPNIVVVGRGVEVSPIIGGALVWNYVSPQALAALPDQSLLAGEQMTEVFGVVARGEASIVYHYDPNYQSQNITALVVEGRKALAGEVAATQTAEYVGFWKAAASFLAEGGPRVLVGAQVIHTLFSLAGYDRFAKNYEKEFGEKPDYAAAAWYFANGDEHPKCPNCT